jgi:hypothetical protein
MSKDAVENNAQRPGSAWSGTVAAILDPGNIPHVPESNGQSARWSQTELDQLFYLDATCQKQLYDQLPGYLQAMVKEGGWGALFTGLGQGGFSLPFPGADFGMYAEGGAAYGGIAGLNTGRIRQDQGNAVALSTCAMELASMWQNRYHILQGVALVPWVGNGSATLPAPKDPASRSSLPYVPTTGTGTSAGMVH